MRSETCTKLQNLHDALWTDLCRAGGYESYEMALSSFREAVREEGQSFAEWLLHRARREYPVNKNDTFDAANFDAALKLFENKESFRVMVAAWPEEAAAQIEAVIQHIRKIMFPRIRTSMKSFAKGLPHARRGGRPKAISIKKKPALCKEIDYLRQRGVGTGIAHRRMVTRYGFTLRSVQRVWKECPQNPRNKPPNGIIKP